MERLCVFCGSQSGFRREYAEQARRLGRTLVRNDIGMVYGGGNVGLMGEIADTVLAEGGEAIGIIPEALVTKEVAHERLTELHVVRSMHERKALMAEMSDGFIALPGGFGTLEELFEVITWGHLGLHDKPFGLLNVQNYYAPLIALLDHAQAEGFVSVAQREFVLEERDPDRLIALLSRWQPHHPRQWISSEET